MILHLTYNYIVHLDYIYIIVPFHFAEFKSDDKRRMESWRGGKNRRGEVVVDIGALPVIRRRTRGKDHNRRERHQHVRPARVTLADIDHSAATIFVL